MSSIEGLPLRVATDPAWAAVAAADLDALLIDHAHCEMKAASMAMSLIAKFGDHSAMVGDLTVLAHEELRHFERVHAMVRERGRSLTPVRSDRYVRRLRERGTSTLVDMLIVSGFVEARSCERFRLLAEAPVPKPLQSFYRELAAAEGKHHELFIRLATGEVGVEESNRIVAEMAVFEGELVKSLPHEARIH